MKPSHTPGPWTAELATPDEIAHVSRGSNPYNAICSLDVTKTIEESNANALLVAAAPELLQTIEELFAMYSDHSRNAFDLVEIRSKLAQAIAKATGGK